MNEEFYEHLGQWFEWDRMKATQNAIKHRVRFTEAASVFFDENARFDPDPDHSEGENHYIVLGVSIRGERIRIISARPAEPRERREYANRIAKS